MNKKISFKKFLITSFAIFTILLLIISSYSLYLFSKINKVNINRNYVVNSDSNNYNNDKFINICIIGSDQYSENNYSADSIIILTLDKLNKKIKLTSLMRDMYVVNPNTHEMFNLNEAILEGGYELLLKTINTNFNLSINKFVEANLNSFPKIVDTLDGITIDIKEEEIDGINKFISAIDKNNGTKTKYITAPGSQLLNGTQTAAYCRLRSESGRDDVRTQRQRYVLSCIFDKIKTTNLLKYPSLANTLLPLIKTNLNASEIIDVILTILKQDINNIEENKFPLDKQYEMLLTDGDKFHLSIDIENTANEINKYIYSLD